MKPIQNVSAIKHQQPVITIWNNQHSLVDDRSGWITGQFKLVDQFWFCQIVDIRDGHQAELPVNCIQPMTDNRGLAKMTSLRADPVQRHVTQLATFVAVEQQIPPRVIAIVLFWWAIRQFPEPIRPGKLSPV